ncbi:MAG TPA: histidine kinase [Ohtaekwangia sp.]
MPASSKFFSSKLTLGYVAWWLVLISIEAYAITDAFDFSWVVALQDATTMIVLVAVAGQIMHNSVRYYQPSLKRSFQMIAWSIALAILCVVAHRFIVTTYLLPDNQPYLTYLAGSYIFRGLFIWIMISMMGTISWIWFYFQDQRASESREQDVIKLAREAELTTLRQQLQPHFLFNSLNSISALAGSRPEEARKMIQQLSDFLRGTIKRDNQQLVTLEEELNHLYLYLEIEKVRFGHRMKTEIEKDEAASGMMLPSLLLQPVVENAIKFGLYDTTGEIIIRIRAQAKENELVVTVENPFDAETTQPKQGVGFGLTGIQRRLYLLYARNNLLTTRQEGNQLFITEVTIPQKA